MCLFKVSASGGASPENLSIRYSISDRFASMIFDALYLYYNFRMIEPQSAGVEKFNDSVGIKFQLYNSLFLSLPFYGIDKTGILLSLFSKECEDGYQEGLDPVTIIETFLQEKPSNEVVDLLFKF